MQLSILDRFLILRALPQEGNIVTLRVLNELKNSLGLTEEEIKKHNVRIEGTTTLWDNDEYKDIPIGERAFDIIRSAFDKLNTEQKLTEADVRMYEIFVEKKEVIR